MAGEKVTKEPHVIDKPTTHEKTEQLVEEFPEIFPSCVVTRSMSKQDIGKPSNKNKDTFDIQLTY